MAMTATLTPATSSEETNKGNNGNAILNGDSPPSKHADNPKDLIPELCRHFYNLGWASGTGGGLSIRQEGRIFCAPSGVQKERIKPEDMFVLDDDGQVLESPANKALRCSECLPLFMAPFKLRNAGCCIHSHSMNANLVTALCSEQFNKQQVAGSGDSRKPIARQNTAEFRIKNQEMIKGIKRGACGEALRYNEVLRVPIIENVLYERDLAGTMYEAVRDNPETNAVLVRSHGVYVWGRTWEQAKSMAECYDYLFKLKLEAHKYGFDWISSDVE